MAADKKGKRWPSLHIHRGVSSECIGIGRTTFHCYPSLDQISRKRDRFDRMTFLAFHADIFFCGILQNNATDFCSESSLCTICNYQIIIIKFAMALLRWHFFNSEKVKLSGKLCLFYFVAPDQLRWRIKTDLNAGSSSFVASSTILLESKVCLKIKHYELPVLTYQPIWVMPKMFL